MKTFVILSLSFFACLSCFAQDVEKSYFENHPELGGDAVIKSASFKAEKDGIYKTFEVESLGDGAYYLDAWITAPIINGKQHAQVTEAIYSSNGSNMSE